jgi:hypothetical protein
MEDKNFYLELALKIEDISEKTRSKTFKNFKKGDIVLIQMPIVRNSYYGQVSQVWAKLSRISLDKSGNFLDQEVLNERVSMTDLEYYLGPSGIFKTTKVDPSYLKIMDYCTNICLVSGTEVCDTCPLRLKN